MPSLFRRELLKTSAAATLALRLERLAWAADPPAALAPPPRYGDFRDVYRERWRWERVVHGTHTTACSHLMQSASRLRHPLRRVGEQFGDGASHQEIAPSLLKVTQLVGDYGQLHWGYAHHEPNQPDRDTRLDAERVAEKA